MSELEIPEDVRDLKPVERALAAERHQPIDESPRVETGKAVREDRPARDRTLGIPSLQGGEDVNS
jgi:hypothetical protein